MTESLTLAAGTALDDLNLALLVGSVVLIVAIVAVRVAASTSLPTLLLYLGLGLLLGEDVIGIEFDDHELTRVLGYAALVVILAEGGLTTSWRHVKPAMVPAAVLATVGVGVSMGVTGVAAHFLLDLSWRNAFLLGAIVSSTDAAAVFSVLRLVPLRHRVAGILEAESGFNDAPVVILVVTLCTSDALTAGHLGGELLLMAVELVGGASVGVAVGFVGAAAVRRIAFPSSGLYPIIVLALAACAYSSAALLHTSGFLAVYIAALILGNSRLPHGPATRGFVEGLAWLSQIGLFVLLGLLVSPSDLGDQVLPAIGVGFVLLLLARPLSVALTTSWFSVPWREQAFLSWAGLRGAVPIVFATIPVVEQVPGSEDLFEIVFILAVFYTLVQGTSLPWMAQRLRVTEVAEVRGMDLEVAPLERLGADVLTMRIPEGSRLHGVEVFELRLPPGASVSLIVREGTSLVPEPTSRLRYGDDLLIVCPTPLRKQTEDRLHAVGEHGRLAGWLGQQRPKRQRG
ncbi:MAG: potassium/proton antiporter [Sporichthyaceae bacterium]